MRKAVLFLFLGACGWDPSHPFDRDAPLVKQAIGALDAGDANAASELLEQYLSTGACSQGKIGAPETLKTRPNGTFDLGLSLFKLGEAFGRRFGEEEIDAGVTDEQRQKRSAQIDCAIRIVQAIADDDAQPIDLRARARYLEGNLHFLNGEYEQAVKAYDKALTLAPGMGAGDVADAERTRDGDPVGRDAAWNRAIALKRIEDKKDAGQDSGADSGGDSGQSDGGDAGGNDAGDGGDSGGGGDGGDAGDSGGAGGNDGGQDSGGPDGGPDASPQTQNEEDAAAPPPTQTQDDRVLDKLEGAPTFQQEVAKKAAQHRAVRGVLDK